jgi:hypothetical protein
MTISSPNFTRLQDGIKNVDDLRVRGPLNVALAWLSGSLVTQLNSHFGQVSNSISAQIASLLGSNNTWTGSNTYTGGLQAQSSDAGAGGGPFVVADRNSASPAANDLLGGLIISGRNSIAGSSNYVQYGGQILDPTNGSEDGRARIVALVAGAATNIALFGPGVQIGSPTGGDQGAGTLNMDNAIFRDGTQVVNTRVTGYGDPFGALSRATFSTTTVTTAALASFVAAMYTDLKAHGLVGN